MGIQTKGKTIIVEEETYKLTKQDIEFLVNIIENSMVPGKYIGLANHVIGKLRNQYKMAGKSEFDINTALKDWSQKQSKVKPKKPTERNVKTEGEDIWIEK
tara:strand:+ start:608 stop:910 length:303 start_codon:yes stop_codon:yes gene_type:complete